MRVARHNENILLILQKDQPACDVEVFIDGVRLKSFTQSQLMDRPNIGRFYLFRAHGIKGIREGACITVVRRGTHQVLVSAKLTSAVQSSSAQNSSPGMQGNRHVNLYTVTFFDYAGKKLYNGGAERYLIDLAQLLKKLGWVPRIVQAAHGSWTRMYFDIEVTGVNWAEEGMLGLSRSFAHSPPAACHIYSPFTIAASHAAVPSIGISHGVYWDNGANTIENTSTKLEVLSGILHCSAVISVDANTINAVQSVRPDLAAKLIYIPNYVDMTSAPALVKKEPKHLTILYPRRLYAPRGFDLTIEAATVVLGTHAHTRFLFVGDVISPELEQLKALMAKFPGRVEHVTLPFEDMPQAYLRADIVLIPTKHSEGTSLSCLEAMQFGLAMISTFVGGLSNLVLDEFNGLLIPPTTEALICAINRLVVDSPLRKRLGANAVEVARCFSKNKWQGAWEHLIQKTFGLAIAPSSEKAEKNKVAEKFSKPIVMAAQRMLVVSSDADLLPVKPMKSVIEGVARSISKAMECTIDIVTDSFENGGDVKKYPKDAELYQRYTAILSYNSAITSSSDLLKLSATPSFIKGEAILAILSQVPPFAQVHSKLVRTKNSERAIASVHSQDVLSQEIGKSIAGIFDLLVARRAIYEILSANVGLDSPIHLGLEVEKRRNRRVQYVIGSPKLSKPGRTDEAVRTHVVSTSPVHGQFVTCVEKNMTVVDILAVLRSVDAIEIHQEPHCLSDHLIFLLSCILHSTKVRFSEGFIKKTENHLAKVLRLKPAPEPRYLLIDQGGRPSQYSQHQVIHALFTKALDFYWRQVERIPVRPAALDVQIFPASEGLLSPNERTVVAMFQACRVDNGAMEFVAMLPIFCTKGLKSIDIKFQTLNDVQQSPKLCQTLTYLGGALLSSGEFALRRDHVFSIDLDQSLSGTLELMLCIRVRDSRHNFESAFGVSVAIDRVEAI